MGCRNRRRRCVTEFSDARAMAPKEKINGLITDAALEETDKLPNSAMTLGDINRRLEKLEAEFDILFNQSGSID